MRLVIFCQEGTTAAPTSRLPSNIVKIAVKFYQEVPTKLAQMVVFDLTLPLTGFIADTCANWNLENPGDYALQFSEASMPYVTEKNRGEIKNGSVLLLCPSAAKNVASIVESINMGDGAKKQEALRQLSFHSSDVSFVQEFINQQGMSLLINIIEGGGWDKSPATAPLSDVIPLTLGCFLELMDHGIVSWDVVDQAFISKVGRSFSSNFRRVLI
jgi:engulfment and cell motility protein 1